MEPDTAARLLNVHTAKITNNTALMDSINAVNFTDVVFVTVKQKLYHIANNIQTIPICANPPCDHNVKWSSRHQYYPQYCSKRCSNQQQTEATKQKRRATNVTRYGGRAPACSNDVVNKAKQTNIARYGVDYAISNNIKSRAAVRRKYGVDNASQIEAVKDSKIHASRARFGTNHPQQSTSVRNKTLRTIKQRYGVDNINQIHIPLSTLTLLNDVAFLRTTHVTLMTPISTIAETLGVSHKCVSEALSKHNIPITVHNNKISTAEQQVFNFIKQYCPDAVQSERSILSGKELDIYIPSLRLAIEYCGLYWHSSAHERIHTRYHQHKMHGCNKRGIRLITIFENEWVHKRNIVEQKLLSIIGVDSRPSVYARNTTFSIVDTKTAKSFIDKYHIQGAQRSFSYAFGLFVDNLLVAVATFTKRKQYMELTRFCCSVRVIGGFSKIFANAHLHIKASQYVSFADLRWSEGGVYHTNGWTLDKILPPDYKYIEGNELVHKFNYRHSNLHNKLSAYDPLLSEQQNTNMHNVHRVYDCGLKRYIISK